MAKDKNFEAQYKAERQRRTYKRKEARIQARKRHLWLYGESSDGQCPDCGGQMSWCSCCQQWSQYCCVEYGTCQCS